MADIVKQGHGFDKIFIESQSSPDGASQRRDLVRVR
jgi:hypothetical protein